MGRARATVQIDGVTQFSAGENCAIVNGTAVRPLNANRASDDVTESGEMPPVASAARPLRRRPRRFCGVGSRGHVSRPQCVCRRRSAHRPSLTTDMPVVDAIADPDALRDGLAAALADQHRLPQCIVAAPQINLHQITAILLHRLLGTPWPVVGRRGARDLIGHTGVLCLYQNIPLLACMQ
jgi:hypothetical protein